MDDHTYVSLYVLNEQRAATEQVIMKEHGSFDETNSGDTWSFFKFYEVNYGKLDFLPGLAQQGIAYDSHWESGTEYGAGTEYGRFTPEGEFVVKEVYDADVNVDLNQLTALLDHHDALKAHILDHKEKVTPLPWDNQIEYGKIHRMKRLVQGE